MTGAPGQDPLAEVRRQIAAQCRGRRRTSVFTKERPTHWNPREVTDPSTGDPFTDAGAWEFTATCAETQPLKVVTLDKPPGKRAYVMVIPHPCGEDIYIKVELGAAGIIGRSFHYSEY